MIRNAQMDALAEAAFEHYLVAHLRRHFAGPLEGCGEASLRALVRRALRRAAAYGVSSRAGLCRYVDLSVALGEGFEDGPEHAWAAEILAGPGTGDARVEELAGEAVRRLADRVLRPEE
ncbi:hypothetical protein [Longimicrobium sp.]|uniref:hypothetical protein n=1 Tax=Longimicrobium sp. TaxID=2029185 RepID=UPI002BBBAABB|nr:hypothetical protein [Longimicrobium sp.]HSU14585.1 hypothetical protein [Longimicrobium sp.]